jgi:hypothetical protein
MVIEEEWLPIKDNPDYLISNYGRVYNSRQNQMMAESKTPQGDRKVTLSTNGDRVTRSIRVLVAEAFVAPPEMMPTHHPSAHPDTVIMLDNDQDNVVVWNLAWRPRWFAHKYARQFKVHQPSYYYENIVINVDTIERYANIVAVGTTEGVLFDDVFRSITMGEVVYPTNSRFIFA